MLEVRPFSTWDKQFRKLADRGGDLDEKAVLEAAAILRAVREGGSKDLAERLGSSDGHQADLRVGEEELSRAKKEVSEQFLTAFSLARVNIRKFHEYQRRRGYVHDDGDGVKLSCRVRPLARIGICCRDSFSSLLMRVVPAQVAGVGQIALAVSPRADGSLDPKLLAAAKVLGVDEVYRMGGAHAVAAFAYGAEPVARVDKIFGSDGEQADAAKRLLFGKIGVDAPAGNSELVVIADSSANAKFIAADLLAQATQDSGKGVLVLLTTDRLLAEAVRIELNRMAELLEDPAATRAVLERDGALFVCPNLGDAVAAANRLAPARLELMTRDDEECLADVENAGAVFIGPWSAEVAGDCFAGLNSLLPTAGAARFASGLGVDDFVKEISVAEYGPDRLLKTGRHLAILAKEEKGDVRSDAIRERLEFLKLTIE